MLISFAFQKYMSGPDNKLYSYDKNMPIVFIGGMPRSGTTLIRALLDAHPDIRCGEETRVIPRVLNLKHMWSKSEVEATRLAEAGITTEVSIFSILLGVGKLMYVM